MLPLQAVLERIGAWYLDHVPAIHATLCSGATDAELDALERHTSLTLPEAFRTLYRWHDGQVFGPGGVFNLRLLTLDEIKISWDIWKDLEPDFEDEIEDYFSHPEGTVELSYINTGWLGFLADDCGSSVGIDFHPEPAGTVGQLINFGRFERHKYALAPSLEAFLHEYWTRLETGRVSVVKLSEAVYGPARWDVRLHDSRGRHMHGCRSLADLFPSFGAAPTILDPDVRL